MQPKQLIRSLVVTLEVALASSAFALNFSNPAAITIPSNGSATPFPSTVAIAGFTLTINDVNVTLHGLFHEFPADLDILLVGPGGQAVLLMSDVGGGTDLVGVTVTFDDQAANPLPNPITSGTYRPTNVGAADGFPSPAPGGPYGTQLSIFNNTAANGTWSLFVFDDGLFASGSVANGWTLQINAQGAPNSVPEPPVLWLGMGLLVASAWLRRRRHPGQRSSLGIFETRRRPSPPSTTLQRRQV